MNPGDFILLFVSFVLAGMALLVHGWAFNGIGAAILSTAGGLWQLWMQWLRHRSWQRHIDSGFAPGTQHLALTAAIGWFACTVGAGIWLLLTGLPSK